MNSKVKMNITQESVYFILLIVGSSALLTCYFGLYSPISFINAVFFGSFLTISATLLIFSELIFDDYFSPLALMGVPWMGSIALSSLKLSPTYQTVWTTKTWLALLISYVSFAAVAITIWTRRTPRSLKFRIEEQRSHIQKVIYLFSLISILGFLIQISNMIINGDLHLYFQDPNVARRSFWIFGVGYLYLLNGLVVVLSVGYLTRYGMGYDIFVLMVISNITLLFYAKKWIIVLAIVASFITWAEIRDNRFSLKLLWLPVVAILAIFVGYTYFFNELNTYYIAQGHLEFPVFLSIFARPYLYLTTNFANLQVALEMDINHTYGMQTLRPFLKLTLIQDIFGLPETFDRAMYGPRFNANTYLGPLFYDFGWLGILFGPAMYAYLSAKIYILSIQSQSIFIICMYGVVSVPVIFGFFGSLFTGTIPWVYLIVLYATFLVQSHYISLIR